MKVKNFVARLYILNGTDVQGSTDPTPYYLKVFCGEAKIDDKDYTLQKEVSTTPQFYKCFEFPVSIPGPAIFDV